MCIRDSHQPEGYGCRARQDRDGGGRRSGDRHRRGRRIGREGPSKYPAFRIRGRRTPQSAGRRHQRIRNRHAHRYNERPPLMVATLLRLVGIDVKRLARETAITIVLAMLGTFAAMLALTFSFVALYLWLELKLGAITALGILGGTSALLAGVLFAIAFLRAPRKPRARAEDALRVRPIRCRPRLRPSRGHAACAVRAERR